MVRAVMSMYDGAKTRVMVGSAYSEEFEVKVGVCCRDYCLQYLWALLQKMQEGGVVNELLYADDLVIMSETMKDLKERFWNWKDVLESVGLKVNTRKTKLMVSRSEGELYKTK